MYPLLNVHVVTGIDYEFTQQRKYVLRRSEWLQILGWDFLRESRKTRNRVKSGNWRWNWERAPAKVQRERCSRWNANVSSQCEQHWAATFTRSRKQKLFPLVSHVHESSSCGSSLKKCCWKMLSSCGWRRSPILTSFHSADGDRETSAENSPVRERGSGRIVILWNWFPVQQCGCSYLGWVEGKWQCLS